MKEEEATGGVIQRSKAPSVLCGSIVQDKTLDDRERKTLTILTRSHFHGEVVYFSLSSTTQ